MQTVVERSAAGAGATEIGVLKFGLLEKTEVSVAFDDSGYMIFLSGIPESFPLKLAESDYFQFDH